MEEVPASPAPGEERVASKGSDTGREGPDERKQLGQLGSPPTDQEVVININNDIDNDEKSIDKNGKTNSKVDDYLDEGAETTKPAEKFLKMSTKPTEVDRGINMTEKKNLDSNNNNIVELNLDNKV